MAAAQGGNKPIAVKEILRLTQHGIDQAYIKFKNVTLQSDKYICVLEEGKSVAILETANKNLMRLPVAVDSAIMNPVTKDVALRSKNALQLYSMERRVKIKSAQMASPVVFWKWIDASTIALVTADHVYHWSMDGDAQPVQVFARDPNSQTGSDQVQVINYRVSHDGQFMILGGIKKEGDGIKGVLQVFSKKANASQPTMDSHAACFSAVALEGAAQPSSIFCWTSRQPNSTEFRLNFMQVDVPSAQALKKQVPVKFRDATDFPVSLIPDNKFGVVFLLSMNGLMYVYDVRDGQLLYGEQASQATMFRSVEHSGPQGGIMAVDQGGRLMHFFIDPDRVVKYISDELGNAEFAAKFAARNDLPGGDGIFQAQFNQLMATGRHADAIQLAATSPGGVLRTADTINLLKNAGGSLLGQYFQKLLAVGKLNAIESLELTRPILQQNNPQGLDRIKDWIAAGKLEPTEELGDLLKGQNLSLALSVYLRAQVNEKVVGCFLSLGAQAPDEASAKQYFGKILAFCQKYDFHPDFNVLVQQLLRVKSPYAKDFAQLLLADPEGAKIDLRATVDTFALAGDVKAVTAIVLEYLKRRGDRPEDADLQTKVLEINLLHAPHVVDAILESDDFQLTHYDKTKIGVLCERSQLFQRALEHYTELPDIKRVLAYTHMIKHQFLLDYFGRMSPEHCLECLDELLKFNLQQNLRLVVDTASKWSDQLGPQKLIALFDKYRSAHGLYVYLGSIVNTTEDPELVFKYIESAAQLEQVKEVERVCRDNNNFDPERVKEFLLQTDLIKDPRPLIHVCDRFGYVDELTQYLYSHNLSMFIEAYVQRMNQKAAPPVIGALLDLSAPEDLIQKLLVVVRPPQDAPDFTKDLVEECEKRGSLKLLKSWLEDRAKEGHTDPHVHNGLAKIYVDSNPQVVQFLNTNEFYDSAVIGEYCESRDPHLAFIAYKRARGACDDQLIAVTNANGFFKDQARYLVERQDLKLWAKVLTEDNPHRRQLIDQVVSTALPESRVAEEVSVSVKAFMAANLPRELIELLERIILHGSGDGEFQDNRNLQNLLILTAIKAEKQRVMDYVRRLDNFDGPEIARIAVTEQYQLYEEAFFILKKFKDYAGAIGILLQHIQDMARALEFAEYADQPAVWSLLAQHQLQQPGMLKEAIAAFLKAEDPAHYEKVIAAAKSDGEAGAELIDYLMMVRGKTRDPSIDNTVLFTLAKLDRLPDMQEFITNGSHSAKLVDVAELCFSEELYQAARLLFDHVNNNARLAVTYVKLEMWHEAVEAARKAKNIDTWKAVCFACVDAQKFKLAQQAGLNILGRRDLMMELIQHYEVAGHFDELISLLEGGMAREKVSKQLYTQLGLLYSKYKEGKLMEHLKTYRRQLNIPTLITTCKANHQWPEVVFLYSAYEQWENAAATLMQQSGVCWNEERFKEVMAHVGNTDTCYAAIQHYMREQPLKLNELLSDLSGKIDHTRVVNLVKDAGHLPLIKAYLQQVQHDNVPAVNEALNELYLEEEDCKRLRDSISEHDAFDQIALAMRCEKHELLEFRRIAAELYQQNKRWERSLEISKRDRLWGDSMTAVAKSGNAAMAEKLLRLFVEENRPECFCACLYTCYDLVRPDLVLELSWRLKLMDFAMPFLIQTFFDFGRRLQEVEGKLAAANRGAEEAKKAQKEAEANHNAQSAVFVGANLNNPMMMPLAIAPPPGSMPGIPHHVYGGNYPGPGGPGGYPSPNGF